jgi:formylglycine-generating enzyme required for sulfatase activity
VTNSDGLPETVRIPAGDFAMGAEDGDADERPVHRVYVDELQLAVHPVTNREYARFVRATGRPAPAVHEIPIVVTAGGRDRERAFRQLAWSYAWNETEPPSDRLDHPVVLVRFEDALAYCAWLADETGEPVRLPTEAEWEKAARGGLVGKRFPWGDELEPSRANYLRDPSLKAMHGSRPVRSYPPNPFGLHDMCGNAWQWVADWYDPSYYATSPDWNPQGPADGRLRVVRGGGWLTADPRLLSCAHRHKVPIDTYSYSIGFRVAY